jgi:hypothetical protein
MGANHSIVISSIWGNLVALGDLLQNPEQEQRATSS